LEFVLIPHVRLLVQLEARIRESASEYQQPDGNQNDAVDARIPKGNLGKVLEADQSHDFRDKFQNAHESNKQAQGVPSGTKGGRIDVALPSPDAGVDQKQDDGQQEPFNGANDGDQSKGDNVGNFNSSPSNLVGVARVGGDPIVQVEFTCQQCGCHARSNVQDVRNPFREGSRQDQNGNTDVHRNPLGSSLRQNPSELDNGEHQKEPGKGINDTGRNIKGPGVAAELPFLLNVGGIEFDVFIVIEMGSLILLVVVDDGDGVSDDETERRKQAHKIHGKSVCLFVCFVTL